MAKKNAPKTPKPKPKKPANPIVRPMDDDGEGNPPPPDHPPGRPPRP